MKTEIDSLKRVVKGYEKGQTMPNISRDILDLIKIPENQHQVELQNGTVVSGELLQESDSTLTLKTQIGTLVLKKEMVISMDELEEPGPNVVFIDDPFIDYYPDKQIFSGEVITSWSKDALCKSSLILLIDVKVAFFLYPYKPFIMLSWISYSLSWLKSVLVLKYSILIFNF